MGVASEDLHQLGIVFESIQSLGDAFRNNVPFSPKVDSDVPEGIWCDHKAERSAYQSESEEGMAAQKLADIQDNICGLIFEHGYGSTDGSLIDSQPVRSYEAVFL